MGEYGRKNATNKHFTSLLEKKKQTKQHHETTINPIDLAYTADFEAQKVSRLWTQAVAAQHHVVSTQVPRLWC